ncbi:hypothetical protein PORY_000681 [Pneumocystis oryctolagi]|uniref:Uncharacterized protein n=1 Tax=Pneumocystis oryctolagi TaxID=42067 RepID=A0ACB7CDX1_9ASCO|nr:hypothetical protein PORY_000681 [Pneumocystis oryctolagi]
MIQKKIGRLGQWTKEKVRIVFTEAEQPTQATEEFKELELEMQTRQEGGSYAGTGTEKLYSALCLWMKSMVSHQEDGRHTLMDIFSRALLGFGEKLSPGSAYGQGLLEYGEAHKEMSKAQEHFVKSVSSTVLDSIERSLVQFKDYQAARRKLENRRLSYDSVSNRFPKAKKEDSKIEEELRVAKAKYEEACENIYTRIYNIQQSEATHLNNLTTLLDMECKYYESCYEIVQELRSSWQKISDAYESSSKYVKYRKVSAHAFNNDNENIANKVTQPFQSRSNSSTMNKKLSELDLNSPREEFAPKTYPRALKPEKSSDYKKTHEFETSKEEEYFSKTSQEKSFPNRNMQTTDDQVFEKSNEKQGENTNHPSWRKSVFSASYSSIQKNPSTGNFQNTFEDYVEDDYPSYSEDKLDSCLENNSFDSSNTFSRSDISISKSFTCSRTAPGSRNSEPPIMKCTKPPPPPRVSTIFDSNKVNNVCKICDCKDYQESFFKKGQCNQCFHNH